MMEIRPCLLYTSKEMQKAFERRRDLIVKLAKEVPGFEVNVPQGAFYLFPKCSLSLIHIYSFGVFVERNI